MEKDAPEQEPIEPEKRTRVRLAAPRKQLERTIQKMTKLSETTKVSETAMKAEKLVDLLTTLSALQIKLLDLDRDSKNEEQHALIEENERLKSELAARPTDEDIQLKLMLARLDGNDSGRLKKLEGELETLKSLNATLQNEKTELLTTNGELKSGNSELSQQVQSLQLQNAELEYAITKLESQTREELLARIRQLNAASARTS
jgi:hypothetical protein